MMRATHEGANGFTQLDRLSVSERARFLASAERSPAIEGLRPRVVPWAQTYWGEVETQQKKAKKIKEFLKRFLERYNAHDREVWREAFSRIQEMMKQTDRAIARINEIEEKTLSDEPDSEKREEKLSFLHRMRNRLVDFKQEKLKPMQEKMLRAPPPNDLHKISKDIEKEQEWFLKRYARYLQPTAEILVEGVASAFNYVADIFGSVRRKIPRVSGAFTKSAAAPVSSVRSVPILKKKVANENSSSEDGPEIPPPSLS